MCSAAGANGPAEQKVMRSWCLDPKQALIWKPELFSLLFADLLLSKSAARSEEERTSFQVNIFTYL